jgi:hypothetical protein
MKTVEEIIAELPPERRARVEARIAWLLAAEGIRPTCENLVEFDALLNEELDRLK